MLAIAPAAVPRRQKNAPTIAGTVTSSPVDEATDRIEIRSRRSQANPSASSVTTTTTALPTASSPAPRPSRASGR
ncbi:MAG: hypothetical protein U5K43_10155 [Halofilum sp. (in: g-proteobacteria)]|nr:hypothetical protein [Halofilum sp. (in: g-proteobacteria)]